MFIRFLRMASMATGVAWLLLTPVLLVMAEPVLLWSVALGWLLPALCFVIGFYVICLKFDGTLQAFMLAIFGGMFVRLVTIGTICVGLIKLTTIHVPSFLFALGGFYILYLTIELYFVVKFQHQREHKL